MPRQHHGGVVERQAHAGQRLVQLGRGAAGHVGASDGAGEQQVAGEQHGRDVRGLRQPVGHRPPGMAGGVRDGELHAGQRQGTAVGQLPHVVGFADGQLAQQLLPDAAAQRLLGVGEHVAVLGVDPGGHVVRAAHRDHRGDMVDVAVAEDDGDRLEAVLGEHVLDALGREVARVDDDALLTGGGGDHVAVGPPGPGGEPGNEHVRPSVVRERCRQFTSLPASTSRSRTRIGRASAGRRTGLDPPQDVKICAHTCRDAGRHRGYTVNAQLTRPAAQYATGRWKHRTRRIRRQTTRATGRRRSGHQGSAAAAARPGEVRAAAGAQGGSPPQVAAAQRGGGRGPGGRGRRRRHRVGGGRLRRQQQEEGRRGGRHPERDRAHHRGEQGARPVREARRGRPDHGDVEDRAGDVDRQERQVHLHDQHDVRRHPDLAGRGQGAGDGELLQVPRRQGLLRPHALPPAHHRGHLRAAVRRPDGVRQRRPRLQAPGREPDRLRQGRRAGHGDLPGRHRRDGQQRSQHRRQPVLSGLQGQSAAAQLHSVRHDERGRPQGAEQDRRRG
ncbi:hypothetical protein SBRY_70055 [Actinacidiphila bryophytorum]|uniref:Uncharacterized protein n=1 Tax=Actinacidiphila bryophytorum TaxID=1436133 RepID=A0A9W4H6Z1_9ACTN|nr:hypothetical protein SBRY_70055 [Actinacidiphila bryophytorum]